jgi:hypothetical protein
MASNSCLGATWWLVTGVAILLAVPAMPQGSPEEAGKTAASLWLQLLDAGKYADSWKEAASSFRNAVTKEQWEKAMHASREPLGKMISRKLKSATYTRTMPGAPDGEYVVVQYDTSFEHKQTAIETVTPLLDTDGNWRVSGYFIK